MTIGTSHSPFIRTSISYYSNAINDTGSLRVGQANILDLLPGKLFATKVAPDSGLLEDGTLQSELLDDGPRAKIELLPNQADDAGVVPAGPRGAVRIDKD